METIIQAGAIFLEKMLKKDRDYSIAFKINDSAKTSFIIHLPENYNPQKRYSLLFFLHGAVRNNELTDYQLDFEYQTGYVK
jgi:dipeptidyl aminopeptidase/acylaminoacyl peptidase